MDLSNTPPKSDKISPKMAMVLLLLWLAVAGALTFSRLTHPAFGVQGDLTLHYHITRSYAQSFAEGDWLPRWAGLLDGGRGDALFTFYPPLCYFTSAALMVLFGLTVLHSIKAVTFLALLIAQLSAYLLAREFFTVKRSLVVSLGYVLLPAYPLICLHRAFLANAFALGLMPLALLGAVRLLEGRKKLSGVAVFAVSFSAIILSHAITTYLTGLAIGLLTLAFLARAGWRGVLRLAVVGLFTLGLTSFFLLPQLVEADWVQLKLQIVQQDYRNYFLFARPSDTSRYRQAWAGVNDFTSYLMLSQTFTGLLLGLLCWPIWRRNRLSPLVWFGLALTCFGLLISLPASDLLWRHLPGLKFIQFHWRFQPFVALGCALLAGAAMECWRQIGKRPRMLLAAALTWLLVANAIFTVMIARLDEKQVNREQVAAVLEAMDAHPITLEEGRRLQNEDDMKYLPYSANQIYFRPPGSDFILYPVATEPGGAALVSGQGRVTTERLKVADRVFLIESAEPAVARIATYNYPNWRARLDGNEVAIRSEPNTGLMLVDVPPGQHRLSLSFDIQSQLEHGARIISLLAWLALIGWMTFRLAARFRRNH